MKPVHRIPLFLAVLTTIGLFSALLADGWADWLSWLLLLIPLLACTATWQGRLEK